MTEDKQEELIFTDNTNDEVVIVRMPRKKYKVLMSMVDKQMAMSQVWSWFSNGWVLVIGSIATLLVILVNIGKIAKFFAGGQ